MKFIKIDSSEMINYLKKNLPQINEIKNKINYFEKLNGTYLQIKNNLIPFPQLSFIKYQKATIDDSENTITPNINFENGYRCEVSKKGLIGKLHQNIDMETDKIKKFLSAKIR
ncbi:MAG TPA: hypothetical protein VJ895_01725 [Candidatus Nanoarchaeia archaeon]|nr:hypothetical protein [Candidatus Nanoarchaeia archaeon]